MQGEPPSDPACAVCGRRLLPGEQAIDFVTREGERIQVCELCKPRAEAAGWLRPEEIEAAGATAGRERRRGRGAGMLGGLLARRQPERESPERPRRSPEARSEREASGSDGDQAPPPAVITATTVADAIAAFNGSDHRRTVAGLTRTLGSPRATAQDHTSDGGEGVTLTIAWEITWYQWEVVASGRSHEVRESGNGDTIDQLGAADRTWNLMVAVDGTLEEKSSASATGEGQ